MADTRRLQAKAGAGEAESPPLTPKQFEATPEFRQLKAVMREILAVPKAVLDKRIEQAKAESPRKNDPNAPGRKAKRKRRRHD